MTFGDAIKTCFSKYADFNGRASRSEYWWFVLFIVLVSAVLSMFRLHLLSGLFSLATILPSIAAAARRLHDTDKTGWLQLIALIPVLGWIAMIYFLAQEAKEPNRFGAAAG